MPALWAIARVTAREVTGGGLFALLVVFTAAVILFSPFLPFFADPESDLKLVKDMGLSSVVLSGAILAAFHACATLSEEIEERSGLLILAKPVSRAQFVLGKFLGILRAEVVLCGVLGAAALLAVWLEASFLRRRFEPAALDLSVCQGLLLAFGEVSILAAAGILASCVLAPAGAVLALFAFFAAGHWASEGVCGAGWGWLVAWIPKLGYLRISDAVALEMPVSWGTVAWGCAYAALYAALALFLACWWVAREELA